MLGPNLSVWGAALVVHVQGLVMRVQGLVVEVQDLVQGLVVEVQALVMRMQGFAVEVQGLFMKVQGCSGLSLVQHLFSELAVGVQGLRLKISGRSIGFRGFTVTTSNFGAMRCQRPIINPTRRPRGFWRVGIQTRVRGAYGEGQLAFVPA